MDIAWNKISEHITAASGRHFAAVGLTPLTGGSINDSYLVEHAGIRYFVKRNHERFVEMFAAEFAGLNEIAASATLRVPQPLCFGQAGGTAYIVLEYLPLTRRHDDRGMVFLARQLAAMHRIHGQHFGWYRDNTIGSTPQVNTANDNWLEFWRDRRLGFQLQLMQRTGSEHRLRSTIEFLMTNLGALFAGYTPVPSLLHGDLWSGNYGFVNDEPVVFDPAVYYGDREADLAMTELFGGFGASFYRVYHEAYPVDDGYRLRKVLYNLYHILNHVNLFGASYLGQAQTMAQNLVSEIK